MAGFKAQGQLDPQGALDGIDDAVERLERATAAVDETRQAHEAAVRQRSALRRQIAGRKLAIYAAGRYPDAAAPETMRGAPVATKVSESAAARFAEDEALAAWVESDGLWPDDAVDIAATALTVARAELETARAVMSGRQSQLKAVTEFFAAEVGPRAGRRDVRTL